MPGVAVCDSPWPRWCVVRHQTVMGLYVAGLWRYPAKTLAGERLSTAALASPAFSATGRSAVVGPEGPD